MISELFDMFKRTHKLDPERFQEPKELGEEYAKSAILQDYKILVRIILTTMGSDLYAYMEMMEHSERKKEANMIKEYRDIIFGARDTFDRDGITTQHVREAILDVHTKLTVQVEMLKTFEGRQWEAGLHKSLLNDISNFAFYLKESKYPDAAAMVAS